MSQSRPGCGRLRCCWKFLPVPTCRVTGRQIQSSIAFGLSRFWSNFFTDPLSVRIPWLRQQSFYFCRYRKCLPPSPPPPNYTHTKCLHYRCFSTDDTKVEKRLQKASRDKKATAPEKSGLAKLLKALEEGGWCCTRVLAFRAPDVYHFEGERTEQNNENNETMPTCSPLVGNLHKCWWSHVRWQSYRGCCMESAYMS